MQSHNKMNLDSSVTDPSEDKKQQENKPRYPWLSYLYDFVALIAAILLIFSLLFRIVVVSGPSMNNTLIDGDWLLLLSNVIYREPERGDIIVASKDSFDEGAPIIKRVIATEGQTVDIDFVKGEVYVDGQLLDEPYIAEPTHTTEGVSFPILVPKGKLFVMGDNRNESSDSRSPMVGCVDERYVLGVVKYRVAPEFTKID